MKIRINYVSNSSSSSFIVTKDLSDRGITCMELNLEQKQLINKNLSLNIDDLNKPLYLTQYLCDCGDKYNEVYNVERYCYTNGEMSENPYSPEFFNEYTSCGYNSVFIKKEHDVAKQMSINTFIKNYKKQNLPNNVIVQYTNDGVILKYVN